MIEVVGGKRLLSDEELEASAVVANNAMNRERGLPALTAMPRIWVSIRSHCCRHEWQRPAVRRGLTCAAAPDWRLLKRRDERAASMGR
jgi:hypothetical protein